MATRQEKVEAISEMLTLESQDVEVTKEVVNQWSDQQIEMEFFRMFDSEANMSTGDESEDAGQTI